MATQNFFKLPIQEIAKKINSSNGQFIAQKKVTLPKNNLFPKPYDFLIYPFSTKYDLILGRQLLDEGTTSVNYGPRTVTIYGHVHEMIDAFLPSEEIHIQDTQNNSFRLDHLNSEEKAKLITLLKEFQDLQYKKGDQLTFTNNVKHTIRTSHNDPVYRKPYGYAPGLDTEVENQIKEMLDQGIIRESNSPYCSPIVVVPKKPDISGQKKYRIAIDYRNLNEITIADKYPIPNMDEILSKLGGCNYFTTIDLIKGFHQIEMDPESIPKTAFTTKTGHYEYTRMPFGLKNAPATFQRCMNDVLRPLLNKICMVYLDDIIVFSASLEEHLQSLRAVFQALSNANLKLQLDKCEFLKHDTYFLGHMVSPEGIRPNPEKLRAIENYPLPTKPKEIKSFLGLTGFYRKFIPHFAQIAKPLTTCLKKDKKVDSKNPEYIEAFKRLKLLISNDPILRSPDFKKKFVLTTDASNVALGAVLSQDGHPISYISRTLNDHETNYSTIEKELLAIVWATKTFRHYLLGRHFEIASDHQPLCWLHKMKEPNAKLTRWKFRLAEYDFDIKYVKGKENHVADALSRITIEEAFFTEATQHSAQEDNQNLISLTEKAVNNYNRQVIFTKGPEKVKQENYYKKKIIHISYETLTHKKAKQYLIDYFVNNHSALYIDSDADFETIQAAHKEIINPSTTKVIRSLTLLKNIKSYAEFKELILQSHEKLLHPGIQKTKKLFSENYFFPNSQLQIQNIINECQVCNLAKSEHRNTKVPFKLTPSIEFCRDKFVIDIYSAEGKHYLSCIDTYSKFATLEQIKTKDWIECKNALMRIFNQLGKPKLLKADRDGAFSSLALKEWLETEGVELQLNTTKTGVADIERFHKTINEKIRIINTMKNTETDLSKIETILYTYNHKTKHDTTGQTPAHIFLYAGQPTLNTQELKRTKIDKLNKGREDHDIDTRYRKGPLQKGKLDNPYKPTKNVEQTDPDHYKITNRNRAMHYYNTQFKKRKIINQTPTPTQMATS